MLCIYDADPETISRIADELKGGAGEPDPEFAR
jgi:hypothetical protein